MGNLGPKIKQEFRENILPKKSRFLAEGEILIRVRNFAKNIISSKIEILVKILAKSRNFSQN